MIGLNSSLTCWLRLPLYVQGAQPQVFNSSGTDVICFSFERRALQQQAIAVSASQLLALKLNNFMLVKEKCWDIEKNCRPNCPVEHPSTVN